MKTVLACAGIVLFGILAVLGLGMPSLAPKFNVVVEQPSVLAPDKNVITDLINRDKKLNDQRAAFVRNVQSEMLDTAPEANDALGGVYLRRTENDEYVFDKVQ